MPEPDIHDAGPPTEEFDVPAHWPDPVAEPPDVIEPVDLHRGGDS